MSSKSKLTIDFLSGWATWNQQSMRWTKIATIPRVSFIIVIHFKNFDPCYLF